MNAIFKVCLVVKPRTGYPDDCWCSGGVGRRVLGLFAWLGGLSSLLWTTTALGTEPKVSNLVVRHHPGTREIGVGYDLKVDDPLEWRAVLGVSTNNGASFGRLPGGVRGNPWPVQTGVGEKFIWTPPADWLDQSSIALRIRVTLVSGGAPPGMVVIRPGVFTMGSAESEPNRDADEGPPTAVKLAKRYWLGIYEVTQREWEAAMGFNHSIFQGSPDLPVENVRWDEAMAYCRKLTVREEAAGRLPTGYVYRLPTEAEWEYACRAGTKTATAFGDRLDSRMANFDGNHPYNGAAKGPYLGHTTKVGSYPPNAWGLHDMHGNVWEWCLNDYTEQLPGRAVKRLMNVRTGTRPVIRGGDWYGDGALCRSASRDWDSLSSRVKVIGFRVVCGPVVK